MTDIINLEKKNLLLFQRVQSIVSLVILCVCPILLLVGFVPFYGKSFHVIQALNALLKIFKIGKSSFWYCAANLGFAIFYIVSVVKMLKKMRNGVYYIRTIAVSKMDSEVIRHRVGEINENANSTLMYMISIYCISGIISHFRIGVLSWIVLSLLLCAGIFINFSIIICLKRSVSDAVTISVGNVLILLSLIFLVFYFSNLQFEPFVTSLYDIMSIPNKDVEIPATFILQAIAMQFLLPLTYLVAIIRLFIQCKEINGFDDITEKRAKKTLIINMVLLGVVLLVLGYVNGYSDIIAFVGLIFNYTGLICISVLTYICSKICKFTAETVPVLDPGPQEEKSSFDKERVMHDED